ncbi:MAG: ferritin [Ignavibacteriales bacterium]|nr:ferritin [Ignavibacteriales bacterium]
MISKSMQDAINEQINEELYSSYLYLSMAAHFDSQNLPGFAHWMKVQSEEERSHSMKFYSYVYDRGGTVTFKAIAQPPAKYKSPLEIFKQVLAHEGKITKLINKLYEQALKEKDYPTQNLLQWFINEQVEEEKNDNEIINYLETLGDSPVSLMMLDRRLAERK